MKTLDEIKQMMATGETVQADEALKELLEKEPTNLQAKMLYGTCRQLLGDEETFRRIHDELAPVMVKLSDIPPEALTSVPPETLSLWKKYHALWMSLIVSGLVLAGIGVGTWFFGKSVVAEFGTATAAVYPFIHGDNTTAAVDWNQEDTTTAAVDWIDRYTTDTADKEFGGTSVPK